MSSVRKSRRITLSELRFVLAALAGLGAGYLGSSGAPVVLAALSLGTDFDEQVLGGLGTIELGALAVGSLLIAPFVPRFSLQRLAVVGVLVTGAGYVVSSLSHEFVPMALGRLMIGLGGSMAIAAANAAIAASDDPERYYAIIYTAAGGLTATLSLTLPYAQRWGGYPLCFAALAGLCAIALPMLVWLPARPHLNLASAAAAPLRRSSLAAYASLAALLVLGSILIYSLAEQALWQFAAQAGVEKGSSLVDMGKVLSITNFAGLIGGWFALRLGTRLGWTIPILLGSLVSAAGRWGYLESQTLYGMATGSLLWGIGFYFISPYQMSVAAALDRKRGSQGRIAVGGGAMMNLGYALGPISAGTAIVLWGWVAPLILIVGCTMLSLVMMLPVVLDMDRARRRQGGARGAESQLEGGVSGD